MRNRTLLLLTILPLPALFAQGLAPQAAAALTAGLRAPIHDETGPDGTGLWAAGADWKASFHDGMTFYPLPASAESPLRPWRWRTVAVTAGGTPLPLEPAQPKVVGPFRCELDLGDVVEAYDVRAEGLEQTFVLERPLDGDVTILGAIDSDLHPTATQCHGDVVFTAADGTAMRYGAAFAIDAVGHRLPLTTIAQGDQIRLQVPGDWLRRAEWPVVIDPLLGSIPVDGSTTSTLTRVDMDRDDRNQTATIGITWERKFGGDTDLWMLLCSDSLLTAQVVFSRVGTQPARKPQLAYLADPNTWVLAWDGMDYQYMHEGSFYYLHTGGQLQSNNLVRRLPDNASRRVRNLVVGGARDNLTNALEALLVWESDPASTVGEGPNTQIHAARLNVVSDTVTATIHLAGGTPNFPGDCGFPSVSKDRGQGSWMVAWQHLTGFQPMRWDVVAQRVSANGTPALGNFTTDRIGLPCHQLAPVVDGRNGRYLIAFVESPDGVPMPAGPFGHLLRTQRFDWAESSPVAIPQGPSQAQPGGNYPGVRVDSVAFDVTHGSFWAVGHQRIWFTTPTSSMSIFGRDARLRDTFTLGSPGNSAAAVWDRDAQRFALAYGLEQNGYSFAMGQHFVFPARVTPSSYGTSCSPAIQTAHGSFLAGDPDQFLRLSGAPANAMAFVALSLAPANVSLTTMGFPNCNLLVDNQAPAWLGAASMLVSAGGVAELHLPLPSILPELDVRVQWFHTDAAMQTFRSTTGLRTIFR
ncbi:MAG: hypothetical protein IPK26_30470 [Planctomycetes bacterium]|nr:hypothetical protein [Planctomycetota bacterium]